MRTDHFHFLIETTTRKAVRRTHCAQAELWMEENAAYLRLTTGQLAHLPSVIVPAIAAWVVCADMAHCVTCAAAECRAS